jgi:hypothetical protein
MIANEGERIPLNRLNYCARKTGRLRLTAARGLPPISINARMELWFREVPGYFASDLDRELDGLVADRIT